MRYIKAIEQAILLATIVCLSGCTGALDPEDYVAWVRDYDNELHVREEYNDFVFDLQYTPSDYIWLQRYGDIRVPQHEYEAQRKEIEQMQYYTLTISVKGSAKDLIDYLASDEKQKDHKMYYFAYGFQEDIKLHENGDQLPCALFHFEKPVQFNNACTFVLGFENPRNTQAEARLMISSSQFSAAPIEIKISKEQIPVLSL